MVLSNKKLKQKLRANFAEFSLSKDPYSTNLPNPETPKSLKQLLDSTHKPRLSKREKRREVLSSLQINGENNDTHIQEKSRAIKRKREMKGGEKAADLEVEMEENGAKDQNKDIKKKKKKKEQNNVGKNGAGDMELNLKEGSDIIKEAKAPTKKQKKKKKKKKKTKNEKQEKQSEPENGAFPQQIIADTSQGNDDDNKKVYVGGIPYSSTEDYIWSYFDHCGAITDIDCMKFPESGKFRGIAIISFKTEEAAKKALALDGSDMDGLYLKIQPYKTTRTAKSSDFSPRVIEGYNRIYAGNLSWDITEDDIRKLFSDCSISSIRFGEDKETGEFKGYAHVDFSDNGSLTKALQLDQRVVCGRPVKISCAVPRKGAPVKPGSASTPPAAEPQEINSGVGAGKLRRRTCYECGEKGHLSSACPKKQATEQQITPDAT